MFDFMHSSGDDTEVSESSSYCSRTSCLLISESEHTSEQTEDSILFQDG